MLPLSYVAEYTYCQRSAFYLLVDTNSVYRNENEYIQEGRLVHQKIDIGYAYAKAERRVESSFFVFSKALNILGKIDLVEFFEDKIVPIEVKRGIRRNNEMHTVQLILAALCLQEMFPAHRIEKGAIFFTGDRKRIEIEFDDHLIQKTLNLVYELNKKTDKILDPRNFKMQKGKICQGCCFYDLCHVE